MKGATEPLFIKAAYKEMREGLDLVIKEHRNGDSRTFNESIKPEFSNSLAWS